MTASESEQASFVANAEHALRCASLMQTSGDLPKECRGGSADFEGSVRELARLLGRQRRNAANAARSLRTFRDRPPANISVVTICFPDPTPFAGGSGDKSRRTFSNDVCSIARANYEEYCARHGYGLHFINHSIEELNGRPATWGKLLAVREALDTSGYTNVFWMDADSLFMNMETPLELLLPRDGRHLTICGGPYCFLNAGHMMFSEDPRTYSFLDATWATYPPPRPWDEQSAMISVLQGGRDECRAESTASCCSAGTIVTAVADQREQREMNSYLETFQPGDFIIHFADGKKCDKPALMRQYAARVLRGGEQDRSFLAEFHGAVRLAARHDLSHALGQQ